MRSPSPASRLQVATSGAFVGLHASIDGSSLSVTGAAGADDVAVSYDGSGYGLSDRAGFPLGHAQGCDSGGGSELVRCPGGVDLVTIATEREPTTVSVDAERPHQCPGPDRRQRRPRRPPRRARQRRDRGRRRTTRTARRRQDDALIGARTDFLSGRKRRSVMVGGAGTDLCLLGGDPATATSTTAAPATTRQLLPLHPRGMAGSAARWHGRRRRLRRRGGSLGATRPGGLDGPDVLLGDNGPNSSAAAAGTTPSSAGRADRLVGGSRQRPPPAGRVATDAPKRRLSPEGRAGSSPAEALLADQGDEAAGADVLG